MLRDMAEPKLTVTIVGAGNLARSLAMLLSKAGIRINEIVARSRTPRAAALARRCKARLALMEEGRFDADVTWLLVSDSAIGSCARQISAGRNWKGKVVLHASGALSSDELQSLRRRGASIGSAHPMMTFVAGHAPRMERLAWTAEGDVEALAVATRLIRKLGGTAFKITKRDKPLYHAFGAFLSPLLVVHLDVAARVANEVGIPRKQLARFMEPILRRTLENYVGNIGEVDGAGKAFSGPLVRGDVDTIERHLKALRRNPRARALYLALLKAAVESTLPVAKRREIRALANQ